MTDPAALYVCEPECPPDECDCPRPRAKPPEWYDEAVRDPASPHLLDNPMTPWHALYMSAAEIVRQQPTPPYVIDIGCGTGRFAALIDPARGTTRRYAGFDFSEAMLEEARRYTRERCDETRCVFGKGDARGVLPTTFLDEPDRLYVMLELLEHLDDDLALLDALPANARVLISVPSSDSESHVRYFPGAHDALERYDGAVTVESWQRIWTPERHGFWHLMTGTTPSERAEQPRTTTHAGRR